jgi:hypothetical protein
MPKTLEKGKLMRKGLLVAALAVAVGTLTPALGSAGVLGALAGIDVTTLFSPDDPAVSSSAANQPSSTSPPKLAPGGTWALFGTAKRDLDPENDFNEVISFDTTASGIAGAFKKFGGHVKVHMLDDQVELKYYFVGRTCAGDGPRIQLGIDRDGDGDFDGNAFGHLGNTPFGGGCLAGMWVYEDMTNPVKKWDLSQFPGSGPFCGGNAMTCSWDDMEAYFATHPNHDVLNEVLVDDAGSFAPTSRGCGYFDVVSGGLEALTRHADTTADGSGTNNC